MLNVKAKKKDTQDAKGTAKEHRFDKFEVKIVSVTGDKLSVTCKAGKNYTYRLAKDAKITLQGSACKPQDLKVGSDIRVTTKSDERNLVIEIESVDKGGQAEDCCS